MRIKIHSSEMNRMMKTIVQCVDQKDTKRSNINISHDNNLLMIRATNGQFSAVMSSPVLGGDGESFCVDGTLFSKVCALCNGEIEIITDGKICTVKGSGRTRLPIVNVDIPSQEHVKGNSINLPAEDFSRCYGAVAYAVSTDQSRLILTGVLIDADGHELSMVALDGFQMAIEKLNYDGKPIKAVIPGAFMKLIGQSTSAGETLKLSFSKTKVQVETEGMVISCGLLTGDYVDYKRILPTEFKTECLVNTDSVRSALKSGSVINTFNNLVKFQVEPSHIVIMSNSEQADYDAEINCETHGDGLAIAFNQKYIMNTMNVISTDEAVLQFNTPLAPCIIHGRDDNSVHLVLPVRTVG